MKPPIEMVWLFGFLLPSIVAGALVIHWLVPVRYSIEAWSFLAIGILGVLGLGVAHLTSLDRKAHPVHQSP